MKKLFEYFPQGSPMHIVLHAQYRRSRGRRPVAISATTRDPRKALREAENALSTERMVFIRLAKPCKAETVAEAMDKVGLRLPTQDEVMEYLKQEEKRQGEAEMRARWLDTGRENPFRWPESNRIFVRS